MSLSEEEDQGQEIEEVEAVKRVKIPRSRYSPDPRYDSDELSDNVSAMLRSEREKYERPKSSKKKKRRRRSYSTDEEDEHDRSKMRRSERPHHKCKKSPFLCPLPTFLSRRWFFSRSSRRALFRIRRRVSKEEITFHGSGAIRAEALSGRGRSRSQEQAEAEVKEPSQR